MSEDYFCFFVLFVVSVSGFFVFCGVFFVLYFGIIFETSFANVLSSNG